MRICVCEIEKRWPKEATAFMALMVELDKRGIVDSTMSSEHGRMEKFWGPKR